MSEKPRLERLETERLTLRPYTSDDVEHVHALMGDAQVMSHFDRTYDRAECRRMLDAYLGWQRDRGYSLLAVERRSDGAFVGQCGLLYWTDVDDREDVEVAYMLVPQFWGHGYASEAARACRDWAFANLPVDRVVSYIAVENAPSIAVAERNGMRQLKRLDQNRFKRPIYVYGIGRDEWRPQTPV